ncbi:MAG: UxaA family hydrolase [Clostridiaceae bacterium]|nr:UxaA family hydrolase [Clostridiaceae bacterium]
MVKNTIAAAPSFGRCQIGLDAEQHKKTLIGLGKNPNVFGVVLISLEITSARQIADEISVFGKPVEVVTFQDDGGTINAIAKAVRYAKRMVIEASKQQRERAAVKHLILGTECGGSDTTSGSFTNPAIGNAVDRFILEGASAILSETAEWIGAEEHLCRRCASPEIAEKIMNAIRFYEDYVASTGESFRGANPTPDNMRGGLTTIREKALGSVKKGGNTTINEFIFCGERPVKHGLILMDAPAAGVENTTALAAAGCSLILFSTGVGNAIGNPIVPTIKISANNRTAVSNADNMDIPLSYMIEQDVSIETAGENLTKQVLEYANGKLTASEVLGTVDISISRFGYTV